MESFIDAGNQNSFVTGISGLVLCLPLGSLTTLWEPAEEYEPKSG